MTRATEALDAFKAAEELLDKATDALHEALCDARTRLAPYGSSVFEEYRTHPLGLTICYSDRHDGDTPRIELTNADLQADDPAQAYLDRIAAEKSAHKQMELAATAQRNRSALIKTLAAPPPEERASLMAEVEGKN